MGALRPFRVARTINGNLPVWKKYREKEVNTIVRQVEGDLEAFRREIAQVCEERVREKTGSFEIRGVHTWKIKEWLASLGF